MVVNISSDKNSKFPRRKRNNPKNEAQLTGKYQTESKRGERTEFAAKIRKEERRKKKTTNFHGKSKAAGKKNSQY